MGLQTAPGSLTAGRGVDSTAQDRVFQRAHSQEGQKKNRTHVFSWPAQPGLVVTTPAPVPWAWVTHEMALLVHSAHTAPQSTLPTPGQPCPDSGMTPE